MEKFAKQGGKIFLYQSKDDVVVVMSEFEQYKKALPQAKTKLFENRGHFMEENFPELVEEIKNL